MALCSLIISRSERLTYYYSLKLQAVQYISKGCRARSLLRPATLWLISVNCVGAKSSKFQISLFLFVHHLSPMGAINELRTMFPIPRVVSRDLPISPKFRSRSPGRYAVFALKHQEAIKRVLQPLEDMFQDHDRLKGERGLEFKLQGKIIGNSSLSTSCGR